MPSVHWPCFIVTQDLSSNSKNSSDGKYIPSSTKDTDTSLDQGIREGTRLNLLIFMISI
uniref:Uncharacterized protein n=1 Tax=Rhizophagus irregularis (strain DAOM 181602 / DAOM 197198 / MUCL 43194) TaxID=747089 RepID=U9TSA6_RHIID